MNSPKLSILISTIGKRNQKLLALLDDLLMQIEKLPVEIVAYWNCGEQTIGDIRQSLLKEARGEYVCFVDDDDKVPEYYVAEILKALGKDYVGFQVELFNNGKQMPPVYHSIKYGIWSQDENGYYRGITHLNPIKRKIALKGTFGKDGLGEDAEWARTIMADVRTENYIDKIMYYYLHERDETMFSGAVRPEASYERPAFKHPQFRWHPKSKKTGVM